MSEQRATTPQEAADRAADRARFAEATREAVINAVEADRLASDGVNPSAFQSHELAIHVAAFNADRAIDDWAEAERAALSAKRPPAISPVDSGQRREH